MYDDYDIKPLPTETVGWYTGCLEERTAKYSARHYTKDGVKTLCGVAIPSHLDTDSGHGHTFCKRCCKIERKNA